MVRKSTMKKGGKEYISSITQKVAVFFSANLSLWSCGGSFFPRPFSLIHLSCLYSQIVTDTRNWERVGIIAELFLIKHKYLLRVVVWSFFMKWWVTFPHRSLSPTSHSYEHSLTSKLLPWKYLNWSSKCKPSKCKCQLETSLRMGVLLLTDAGIDLRARVNISFINKYITVSIKAWQSPFWIL